jgi:hypothetical protein
LSIKVRGLFKVASTNDISTDDKASKLYRESTKASYVESKDLEKSPMHLKKEASRETQEELTKSKRESLIQTANNLVRGLSIGNPQEESKKISNAVVERKYTETDEIPSHKSFITSIHEEDVNKVPVIVAHECTKKILQDLSIDGLVPSTLDYIFGIESYQVVILVIVSLNNKGIKLFTLVMGEIIRNLKNFNNLFCLSELIYDPRLSFEERILFENDFVSKCLAITSDKQPLYNVSNIKCNYTFDFQSIRLQFDASYITTCNINLADHTSSRLIFSSKGDEVLNHGNIVIFDHFETYKIEHTLRELTRKLKSLLSFDDNRISYVVVFETRDCLDSRIFKKMFKNVRGKKDNVSLLVYRLFEDDFVSKKL